MADDQMLEGPPVASGKRRNRFKGRVVFRGDNVRDDSGAVVEQLLHKIKEDSRKIGEILKPMKYKMIIGPGSDEAWKTTGDTLNDMCSSKLMSIFAEYDIPVISGMPLHRRLKAEEHNFLAWPVDMEFFPAYLAATIELTMQLATLKDAMHCIQTTTASGKIAARPAAKVLRRKEIITTSQKEEIKTFMQTRDKKIRISQLPDNTTVESSSLEIDTYLCEQIDTKRKSEIAHRAMIIYFREQRNNTKHKLVWKTIPCERLLAGDLYRHYSKETAKLLRHSHLHARDGSVRFKQFADEMYQVMLRPRRYRYTDIFTGRPATSTRPWDFESWTELIFNIRSGSDKPRYQILAPANLNAGGDLVALENYSQYVAAIRALGGHSNEGVDSAQMGRVKITHEICPQLYHVTYRNNLPSLKQIGLRPGGPKPNGRSEVFFSCKSHFEGPNVNIQYRKALRRAAAKRYKEACAALISRPTGQPVLEGYPFYKGDCTLCIDVKKARESGIEFWQNEALAIVTDKVVPSTCFIFVEDLQTGAIIYTPGEGPRVVSKTVRPQAHHNESENKRAKSETPTDRNWLASHTVQTSSSSAGGNLTATNATASSNGIVEVNLDPEVTTPEASSDTSTSSETVAAQDATDSNLDDDSVASPVKLSAGGRHLIKGRP